MKKRKTNRAKKSARSCSNHGSCSWCTRNRLYQPSRELEKIESLEEEYQKEDIIKEEKNIENIL